MSLDVIERRSTIATVVFRPRDALRFALARRPDEQGPVRPVRFRIAGRVNGGVVEPIAEWSRPSRRRTIVNASGDTVYRDFALGAGDYRIEIVRDALAGYEETYADLLPADSVFPWDPATPNAGMHVRPGHPSRLVVLDLRPGRHYPFPAATTLIRGELLWYDGTALAGAVVHGPGAVLPDNLVGPRGDFALALHVGGTPAGIANLQLDLNAVDAATKPGGAFYLANWPAVWPMTWRRGETTSRHQGALGGSVRRGDGLPLAGARVELLGQPGELRTDADGSWRYHFPPLTAAGTVDVRAQHPNHAPVTAAGVPFPAESAATMPPLVMQ